MAKKNSARHMPGLDGLRALAVIAVVWHHTHPGYAFLPISRHGFLGVDVFFVLSGFLITTLLLSEQRATGTISLRNFYIRRSLRIFPLYYLVLALLSVYFAVAASTANSQAFLRELPWHVSYTSNWVELQSMMAITWSLSTEEQFYLVWPPLLALLGVRSLWLVFAFLAFNQVINFGALDPALASMGVPYESLSILQITFTPILLGVLLAFALRVSAVRRFVAGLPAWATFAACLVALAVADLPMDLRGWPRLSFHLATSCIIALVVLRPDSLVVRALEWRPLAYVGTVSYGVYLLHKLVLHVVGRGLGGTALKAPELLFAMVLLGTVGLAALSYHYFESRMLRLKARFQ
jgi:peptidoglycan/LPS O-acetylase OafA/YrhL